MAAAALLLTPLLPAAALPVNLGSGAVAGTFNLVVLLVEFEDVKGVHDPAEVRDWFFSEPGVVDERSVRDYYREVSGGRLLVGGYLHPEWITLPHPMAAYGNSDSDIGRDPAFDAVWGEHRPACSLPYDAAKAVEDQIDFAALANNGEVNLAIVHAGTANDDSSLDIDVWSHAWGVCDGNFDWGWHYVDGVRMDRYMTVSEFGQFGTVAHELGHSILGFADLYHHPDVQQWDLMASGDQYGTAFATGDPQTSFPTGSDPAHLGAWSKMSLGWVTPVVRKAWDPAAVFTLTAAELTGGTRALRLDVDEYVCGTWRLDGYYNHVWTWGHRYFLVEYRDADAARYDGDHPRTGVVVWYIDECANGGDWWGMNMNGQPRVRVVKETGQNVGWAAIPEGGTLSHLSTWSSTVDGRRTDWFVEVQDVSPGEATVRVGTSTADFRMTAGPRYGTVSTSAARAPPATTYESVSETQQPPGPTGMTRDMVVKLALSNAVHYGVELRGAGTYSATCTPTAAGADCALGLDVPPGQYEFRAYATDGGTVREHRMPLTFV